MHILLRGDVLMGKTDDSTLISYVMSIYWQLIETPSISTTFNNFSFHLFLTNTDEEDPNQPYISFEQFFDDVKQKAGPNFITMFRSKALSLRRLL
jgi:hypothetical protein